MNEDDSRKLVVSFYTTAEAMATESACQAAGLAGRLIPVPRWISAGCGIAWQGCAKDRLILQNLLQKQQIEFEGIYEE